MRIPYMRFHRAFPELDRLTAAQCRELILCVRRALHWRLGLAVAAGALSGTVACILAMILIGRNTWLFGMPHNSTPSAVLVGSILAIFVAPLTGLLARDLVLRSGIRRWIDESRCRECSYPLLGLPVVEGRSRCPECGTNVSAAECLGIELRETNTRAGHP